MTQCARLGSIPTPETGSPHPRARTFSKATPDFVNPDGFVGLFAASDDHQSLDGFLCCIVSAYVFPHGLVGARIHER
jgi:hypothetical protein